MQKDVNPCKIKKLKNWMLINLVYTNSRSMWTYMLHSEILASLNFNNNLNLFPWIGDLPYIEMLFQKFSNIPTSIRIVGKLPDQHFNVSSCSNPGGNILILVESRGQICPVVFHLFSTLSPGLENNNRLKSC